jgi:hypothetical protein
MAGRPIYFRLTGTVLGYLNGRGHEITRSGDEHLDKQGGYPHGLLEYIKSVFCIFEYYPNLKLWFSISPAYLWYYL